MRRGRARPRDVSVADLRHLPSGTRIIDVREHAEIPGELGVLPGAEVVPFSTFPGAALSWDRAQPLLMVCRSGNRSARAAEALMRLGFRNVFNLAGGMLAARSLEAP